MARKGGATNGKAKSKQHQNGDGFKGEKANERAPEDLDFVAKAEGETDSSSVGNKEPSVLYYVTWALVTLGCLHILYNACFEAYDIRMYAIREYGRVIHEFDPYFNYRATEYLYANGWQRFKTWFDYMSWYPLGRPVGTTIYPGMQVTSVWIKNHILPDWSINDICCFVPAWFGVTATLGVAFLTYECTAANNYKCFLQTLPVFSTIYKWIAPPMIKILIRYSRKFFGTTFGFGLSYTDAKETPRPMLNSWTPMLCAVASACVMSIVPAHLLRSVGGGYDNESIAMTAMVLTFACWTKSLEDNVPQYMTVLWGLITGIAYFYMVAAWGGFTFVLNLVGVHASYLVLTSNYSTKLHRAYSTFYLVGTSLAVQVPVVGWSPLKSLEQLGPFVAFAGMQLIEYCEVLKRAYLAKNGRPMTMAQAWKTRVRVFTIAAFVGLICIYILMPTGYFGPISSRVRGLFVKHTKTGNPLVDSVAEHQAASSNAYFQYLHNIVYISPVGLAMTMLAYCNDASSFLVIYTLAAYYFSHRMVRLILLTAPIASCLAGIAIGRFIAWGLSGLVPYEETVDMRAGNTSADSNASSKSTKNKQRKRDAKKAYGGIDDSSLNWATYSEAGWSRIVRFFVLVFVIRECIPLAWEFHGMAHELAGHLSHPTIIQKANTRDGKVVKIDDYRDAYFWLRDNTPDDSRVMAWWDYGYQITGIANRTTIADGNTWNHEHIAFLGRTLTAPEKEAHRIARHLADYMLVWAGGGGDDLAKSPHLRRIANSVYRGLCAEPTCRDFGFYQNRAPTESMAESLLFKLVLGGLNGDVVVDRNRFREVYRSKYGKVRIYKVMSVSAESKAWVADPANRLCDAPGSWFCPGQYPPALEKILQEKKDFRQLEDFNANRNKEDDEEYQRQYFENLQKGGSAPSQKMPKISSDSASNVEELSKHGLDEFMESANIDDEDIDIINENWENSDLTTMFWEIIHENREEEFLALITENPTLVHLRSEDGRGPMFWAHEYGRKNMVRIMKKLRVREDRKDAKGLTPLDVSTIKKKK
mmetsp:Transcript_12253/g.33980  ORF Transcript_12253/g.33980 Transcript_12253/m.33980 type:complete len:1039 (+) Transcript_12253:220-3336(+)